MMSSAKFYIVLILLGFALSGCGLNSTFTPPPPGYASTLAAQTWQAIESSSASTPEAVNVDNEITPDLAMLASNDQQGEGLSTLPVAATATAKYPSRTPEPTGTFEPTLNLEQIILTGVPTVIPLITDVLNFNPIITVEGDEFDTREVAPKVGAIAPDFMLVDARTNERIQLSKLEGHPVLINFWATWCNYCLDEMPIIQKAYERYESDGFIVLAVDVEETRQKATNFGDRLGLSFNLLLDSEGAVADEYRVVTMPTSYFVSRQGVIHSIAVGVMDQASLDEHLSTILYE